MEIEKEQAARDITKLYRVRITENIFHAGLQAESR